MPDPNAIVGVISRIDPPTIELEGERAIRVRPGNVARGQISVLEQLQRLRTPVYLEIQPDTREIVRLLIPLVTRVTRIQDRGAEGLVVELEASHARHRLLPTTPYHQEVLDVLRRAVETRALLAVTEADAHELLDASSWAQEPPRAGPSRPEAAPGLLTRIWRWFCGLLWCWCCVSQKRAQELFDLAGAPTCDPLTVPPPCIPFLYPDDGCWARAHEMCRLMIAAGAKPRKVWIDGKLRVNTKNNPNCFVKWGWHVAPIICVRRRRFGQSENMVIDPSLFTTPVT